MCLVEQTQSIEQLLGKYAHQGRAKTSELVLLDQLVEVDTKQLEHKTKVLPVNESVLQAE